MRDYIHHLLELDLAAWTSIQQAAAACLKFSHKIPVTLFEENSG